ncbi:hypothetical protein [Isachenkonia alkalipeptolytica]|uniref:Uncharacterized protein n=1 Tax=Isachenkonia alkalipeptolytica TaxID=2565777 RepID=A0AA43XJ71_9CLOT|nr:hypothetical protein [Isachenkonia alkalipeptolytica]NBG87737.1 hypothetical protein [Isachenkonia alkalipeptolytica]
MSFEIYLIICVIGLILMMNGFRKIRRRDLYTQSPLAGWLIVFATFVFQLFQLELFVNDLQGSWFLYGLLAILGIATVGLFIRALRREMNQTRIRIHNMEPKEAEEMVIAQLEEKEVDYSLETGGGKRRIYSFPIFKGQIILESDYISKNHQLISFQQISEIPMGREIIEDLKEESEKRERPLSMILGIPDLFMGGLFFVTGIILTQI